MSSGFFISDGTSANSGLASNQNYLVGFAGIEIRNYFVFDLTGVFGTITSATLQLYNPIAPPDTGNGYTGDASETYQLTSSATSPGALQAPYDSGPLGQAVFSTLGTGTVFSTITVTAADNGQTLNLVFNSAGLSALNSQIGSLVGMGGRLTSIGGVNDQTLFAFTDPNGGHPGISDTPAVVLTLTTVAPEPTTSVLLALGGVGLIARRRRK